MHVLDVATGEDGSVLLEVESDDVLTGCPDPGWSRSATAAESSCCTTLRASDGRCGCDGAKRIWPCPEPACARRTWTEVQPYATLTARATSWAGDALRHVALHPATTCRPLRAINFNDPLAASVQCRGQPGTEATDQANTTAGSGAGSKDGQVPFRAPSAGPISFWVTSLPPAPVSDDASRNRWIQTHNQCSTGTTSHRHYRPPHQPLGHDLVGGGSCQARAGGVLDPPVVCGPVGFVEPFGEAAVGGLGAHADDMRPPDHDHGSVGVVSGCRCGEGPAAKLEAA
jgi:hypothetical protein